MTGIKALDKLLKEMKPVLSDGEYVFYSTTDSPPVRNELNPILIFREKEGSTLVVEKAAADAHEIAYNNAWRLISLSVHSDLMAVGFLAIILNKLAGAGISVNPVSGFYHDHLFVPAEAAEKAMGILGELTKKEVMI